MASVIANESLFTVSFDVNVPELVVLKQAAPALWTSSIALVAIRVHRDKRQELTTRVHIISIPRTNDNNRRKSEPSGYPGYTSRQLNKEGIKCPSSGPL